MTPTNALVTASPADTVKIITDTIAAPDDAPDRITVQLDPPELGRVSIDFKFDSHGLQHVTVTGENPEALRQLRLMHFELTQALERSGLSSQNMTFQQQQSGQQQAQSSPARSLFSTQDSDTSNSPLITPAVQPARPPRTAGGGLNIRL
jgi:flagellar hook-length control protein FliK